MIIFPKKSPVIENLNSYFIKFDRLYEHYQGEIGSGCIYFKSPFAEGAIFFDEDNLINGILISKGQVIDGQEAITTIVNESSNNNFAVTIYQLDIDKIYFWANLTNAEPLYQDLRSEFTDLEALIQRMQSEKLIGLIEIVSSESKVSNYIFFNHGEVIGSVYPDNSDEIAMEPGNQDALVAQFKTKRATFNVKKVSMQQIDTTIPNENQVASPSESAKKPKSDAAEEDVLGMLQQFLNIFEKTVKNQKKIKIDFDTLLKRKFVEKGDKYDFLDPFADEFQYTNGEIKFFGEASDETLIQGVVESVTELVSELKIAKIFNNNIMPWQSTYSNVLNKFGIQI